MGALTKMYENYYPESILRSVHFWLLTAIFLLTLANVAALFLHWSTMPTHFQFTAVILLLVVPQPWGFTIREHILFRRSGLAPNSKIAAASLTSTTMAYFAMFVAIEALKLAIR